ncbi:MAG: hypothetical protein IJT32_04050, partial [Lachnospiraceae bacterium]|nr:hypothetical protein [Lachnospiraceae bacterium]
IALEEQKKNKKKKPQKSEDEMLKDLEKEMENDELNLNENEDEEEKDDDFNELARDMATTRKAFAVIEDRLLSALEVQKRSIMAGRCDGVAKLIDTAAAEAIMSAKNKDNFSAMLAIAKRDAEIEDDAEEIAAKAIEMFVDSYLEVRINELLKDTPEQALMLVDALRTYFSSTGGSRLFAVLYEAAAKG